MKNRFFRFPRPAASQPHAPRSPRSSSLERLESRIAPAVLASVTGHTLKITGDSGANNVYVDAVSGSTTTFSITTTGGETINGLAGPFVTTAGVKNFVISLKDGIDYVEFGDGGPIKVLGNVAINGGAGGNEAYFLGATIGKGVAILNGDAGTGSHTNYFVDTVVKGSVLIDNGTGDTGNEFYQDSTVGVSAVYGSIFVKNGIGEDSNYLGDTSVGGNVTFLNGKANATTGYAGYTNIYNDHITDANSLVGGNVTVSYQNGNLNSYDGIWDTTILGDVTFSYGQATVENHFDGYSTTLPTVIVGKLTITGTGGGSVDFGTQYEGTGLQTGALSIQLSGSSVSLTLNEVEVARATHINVGNAATTLSIDDSTFHGAFLAETGGGGSTINIETTAGSALRTVFERASLFQLGGGGVTFNIAGSADAQQAFTSFHPFIINKGGGGLTLNETADHEFFPLGGSVKVLP